MRWTSGQTDASTETIAYLPVNIDQTGALPELSQVGMIPQVRWAQKTYSLPGPYDNTHTELRGGQYQTPHIWFVQLTQLWYLTSMNGSLHMS